MKAVIYARYSSDNQREESIDGQIRECKAFAEKQGLTVLNSYIDRAFSAKTDNRPEFQHMVKDSAKHLFDVIIVWKLDRFARNRYDSAHYKATLRKNGVKVISATESIAADSTGILLESLLEGYAEFYSAELSEKVIRGMTENALKCQYNGGAIPIGYLVDENKHFQIDPATAPFVQEAFQMYDDGKTVKQIVKILNDKNVHTFYGKGMNINNITIMLKSRKYIGEYHYRDVVIPSGVPAIVEEDLFNRVQERLEKNKKAPARFKAIDDNYLLTTKLFCGLCEKYMIGESGTSRNGTFHRYYKCATAKSRKGCKKKTVKKDWIEDLVIDEITEMLLDESNIQRIINEIMALQNSDSVALPALKTQLDDTTKKIDNIMSAIEQGVFTSTTKERLEALEEAKKELEIDILQEELFRPYVSEDKIRFWIYKFRDGDMQDITHRQRLVDSFVNAIYLYDDKIVFTFNYKDGAKTVSLKELGNCSDMAFGGEPKDVISE
ncbi:MAG: recombinase family protein [Oscillospiraceae bacterium]|jgi:DNA invertase Pin-like site-specific DNA recombinase|nr:recombinase family protein [Oscillospiraceae bacterium]